MIGVFDSGSGGLTVLSALRQVLPEADILYFGDTSNMPYGTKDRETLERLTLQAMRFLRAQGCTLVVSACNSVSAGVIRPFLELFGITQSSIVEMVGPTVAAIKNGTYGRICLVATPATVKSGMYEQAFAQAGLSIKTFVCPNLAIAVEEDWGREQILGELRRDLFFLKQEPCDTLILGCTHYPLARSFFEEVFLEINSSCRIFDPSPAVAQAAKEKYQSQGSGQLTFVITKNLPAFSQRVSRLFNVEEKQIKNISNLMTGDV